MKTLSLFFVALFIISSASLGVCKTLEEYIEEAKTLQESGNYDQAIAIMEQAVKEYPKSSDAHYQLGLFIGGKIQTMADFSDMIVLLDRLFGAWDKAVELAPENFTVRMYRGIWAVSIPKFSGQLDKGIKDLEFLATTFEQLPDPSAQEQLVTVYFYLGDGYQKKGEFEKAKKMFKKVIERAPGTEHADNAKQSIDNIIVVEKWQAEREKQMTPDSLKVAALKQQLEKAPNNSGLLIALAMIYLDAGNYEKAREILYKVINVDPENVDAYKLLALTVHRIVSVGYDPRIYVDTNFRTDLAFEAVHILDKAVALAPDDIELRFFRGVADVEMPFFVGKLEQGIEDLKMVIESDAPDSLKVQSLYYLGFAHQRKSMTYWIKVVSKYSNSDAAAAVFDAIIPDVKRIDLSKHKTPLVVIDFLMGFRDELAPQTAIWVEDKEGNFVKTIYVSGFSGFAKEKQINLPVWSRSSKFADADAVTGASIDLGHHIYFWNLKDSSGKKVKSGEYNVFVEVSYWPSMQYQRVSAPIKIGKKETKTVVEEGNLIPYLEIKYVR